MQAHSIVILLIEQIILQFVLFAVATGSQYHQRADGISQRLIRRWYYKPSFILASKLSSHLSIVESLRCNDDFFRIRGGSADESAVGGTPADDTATSSSTTSTATVDTDINSFDSGNLNATPSPANITVDEQQQQQQQQQQPQLDHLSRNLTFGATKPHDGSLEDPDGIPTRFLLMKKNDLAEAKIAFEGTLAWRKQLEVDTILRRPHPKYDICKAILPHYFSGRDPNNNVILVQRPAMLNFVLMENNNATIDDLLMHYIYIIEYCWNILEPGPPERVMTNVLDMRGMSLKTIRNQEYIGFGKKFVQMMSENYPGRSYKTLVINAPTWFHALYNIFKPILRESTRQKIVILKAGGKQDAALKFFLGDSLPRDLISESDQDTTTKERPHGSRYFLPVKDREDCEPGPNSVLEFDMRQLVSMLLA